MSVGMGGPRSARPIVAVLLVAGGLVFAGCTDDEEKPPAAEVRTVEAYGVTLGPEATPQEVVYVLLRSIADDYEAAKAKDAKAARSAQELTFSLAAPKIMEERLVGAVNQLNDLHKKSLGDERDARLFKTARYWAPIVGHYRASFQDIDLATLTRDSWVAMAADGRTAEFFHPVAHDRSQTDPAKAETATLKIELNRESAQAGGPEYWRVSRVRFLGRQFPAPSAAVLVSAYGLMLDESATPEQVASVLVRSLAEMAGAEKAGKKDVWASSLY
ncbi:MAG: hypothetical protein HY718_20350, partial [Planctomycetes bacterium]|nr:hypothetical protein [Planctomycetota bacterium]